MSFDLLERASCGGGASLALGARRSLTALFGVIFATVQTDMKRLLAYSSIENIGIIVAGIGLTILFKAYGKTLLAAIALVGDALSRAQSRVLQEPRCSSPPDRCCTRPSERSLGKLGGLIHRMPWVAWLGARSARWRSRACRRSTALSPNGCCCRRFLFTPDAAAIVHQHAGAARRRRAACWPVALGAYVMVKFYGVIFLGRPRENPHWRTRTTPAGFERVAAGVVRPGLRRVGVFPCNVIEAPRRGQHDAHRLDRRLARGDGQLVGCSRRSARTARATARSSCSWSIVAVVPLTISGSCTACYRGRLRSGTRRGIAVFRRETPRMQDTRRRLRATDPEVFGSMFFRDRAHAAFTVRRGRARVTQR